MCDLLIGVQMASYVGYTDGVNSMLTSWFRLVLSCHLGRDLSLLETDDSKVVDQLLLAFKGRESDSHAVRTQCLSLLSGSMLADAQTLVASDILSEPLQLFLNHLNVSMVDLVIFKGVYTV